MKKIAMLVLAVGMVGLTNGCASYMVVQGRNAELDRKAVKLMAAPDGVQAGIDLMGLKGYWAAWKAEPLVMTGATLTDGILAAGTAYLVNEATKKDEEPASQPTIQNNGGTVIVNSGSGDASYQTTTTSSGE